MAGDKIACPTKVKSFAGLPDGWAGNLRWRFSNYGIGCKFPCGGRRARSGESAIIFLNIVPDIIPRPSGGFQVMRSKYSVRAVSVVTFLPLVFLPVAVTGQSAQDNVAPLKNWAAPLYWQPNQSERETAGKAVPEVHPFVTQLSPSPLTFVAISPCRLVDTRGAAANFNGISPFSGPSLGPSTTTTYPVQSAAEAAANTTPTPCGTIPSIAQAYSFNITAIPKTAGGIAFVTVWPAGSPQPGVSTINDGESVILANAAIVPAGTPSGGVNVLNSGPATMDLTIDLNGYYAATADITSVTAGTDLTGGGTGGAVTLNVDTTKIPTLAGTNTFTGPGNFFTGGNVGIGTATPATTLEVNGPALVDGNISLLGDIIVGGHIVYQQPCGNPFNTAVGPGAYAGTSCGTGNTSSGYGALSGNGVGSNALPAAHPTPPGPHAQGGGDRLHPETSGPAGSYNTAHGYQALSSLSSGYYNTAIGAESLDANTTGGNNIAVGYLAGASVSGGNSNNIHIGTEGASSDNSVIRIGGNVALGDQVAQTAFYVSGIAGVNVSGAPVLINTSTGQLGVASSSRRFKEDIQDMSDASDGLMRLRPVTFRYKQPFDDGAKPIQYGLIAEEVAEVYPDLVAHSADGQIETVKYQVLDPMLLNEVQKQYQHARQQDEIIRQQRDQVSQQQEQIRKLEERLSALEASLPGKIPTTATAGR